MNLVNNPELQKLEDEFEEICNQQNKLVDDLNKYCCWYSFYDWYWQLYLYRMWTWN
jgi:hypothetical protein